MLKFGTASVLFVGVVSSVLLTGSWSGPTPNRWKQYDNFDRIKDKMSSVTAENCRSIRSKDELMLPEAAVAQIPKYNQLLTNVFHANRSCLLQIQNMALNRAFYYSFIYQYLNGSKLDFKNQPGLMYYYMSAAADVSAGKGCLNGSAVYFDNNAHYANFLATLPFNNTLNLFAPRAWRADDYNYTIDVHDISAGKDANYTRPGHKPYPWYEKFLPDVTAAIDTLTKFTYSVAMKMSNTTGEFIHDDATAFYGPPQPSHQDIQYTLPVLFTPPYFDCGHSNKWIVSAVSPVVDYMIRYTYWTHLQRARFVAETVMDTEFESIDMNPCPAGVGNPLPNLFAGTDKCKTSTVCEPLSGYGFRRGGYRCVCKPGYRLPHWRAGPFLGREIEQATKEDYDNGFDCLPIGEHSVKRREPFAIKRNKRDLTKEAMHNMQKREVEKQGLYENGKSRFLRFILPLPARTSRRIMSQEREEKIQKSAATKARRVIRHVPRQRRTNEQSPSTPKIRGSFDQVRYDRVLEILRQKQNVTKENCNQQKEYELLLPGDAGFGIDRQFEPQARTALRLAHFLSNYLQNVQEDEQFGDIRGDRLLNETHLYGEVLSNILGDFHIYASGVFFDKYKFRMATLINSTDPSFANGVTREYFGPFAYRHPDPSGIIGLDGFKAIDFAGFKEPYTSKRWFVDMKSAWDTFNSLKKYTMRSMVRSDRNGSTLVRFEHDPLFYHASQYEDGVWLRPEFKCDGMVDEWVVTYVVPFFGRNSLRTRLEFKGVVTVDVQYDLLDLNQCPQDLDVASAFKNTARCDYETTYCEHVPGRKLTLGSYKCECKQGFEYPFMDQAWFDGQTIEEEYRRKIAGEPNRFDTLRCRIDGGQPAIVG